MLSYKKLKVIQLINQLKNCKIVAALFIKSSLFIEIAHGLNPSNISFNNESIERYDNSKHFM